MTLGAEMKMKYLQEHKTLPTCINPGCSRSVQVRDWKNWSFKTECGTCYKARVTGKRGKAMDGITIHKKRYCENLDGHLGWTCPVPKNSWKELGMLNSLDLEHTDGNHDNNSPENVKTICKLCHGKKSIANNDFDNRKSSARKIVH